MTFISFHTIFDYYLFKLQLLVLITVFSLRTQGFPVWGGWGGPTPITGLSPKSNFPLHPSFSAKACLKLISLLLHSLVWSCHGLPLPRPVASLFLFFLEPEVFFAEVSEMWCVLQGRLGQPEEITYNEFFPHMITFSVDVKVTGEAMGGNLPGPKI